MTSVDAASLKVQHCCRIVQFSSLEILCKSRKKRRFSEAKYNKTETREGICAVSPLSLLPSHAGYLNCVCLFASVLNKLKHQNLRKKIKFSWHLQALLLLLQGTSLLGQVACFSPSGLVLFTTCGCAAPVSLFLYRKEPKNPS